MRPHLAVADACAANTARAVLDLQPCASQAGCVCTFTVFAKSASGEPRRRGGEAVLVRIYGLHGGVIQACADLCADL